MGKQKKKRSATKPECLALIICEGVVEDARSHNKCILNTFNRIRAVTFPWRHDRLTVFVTLTNGHGAADLTVQMVRIERVTEIDTVIEVGAKVKFGDPLGVVDLTLDLRGVVVPRPGDYAVKLLINGDEIKRRRICVEQVPESGGGA